MPRGKVRGEGWRGGGGERAQGSAAPEGAPLNTVLQSMVKGGWHQRGSRGVGGGFSPKGVRAPRTTKPHAKPGSVAKPSGSRLSRRGEEGGGERLPARASGVLAR